MHNGVVTREGFEPSTPCLKGRSSAKLSYRVPRTILHACPARVNMNVGWSQRPTAVRLQLGKAKAFGPSAVRRFDKKAVSL